jgi:hypothetical protein
MTYMATWRGLRAARGFREALRRLEEDEAVREQGVIVDPDNANQAILEGLASIERGELIELKDHEELQAFFADIVARGKKRFAATNAALLKVNRYIVSTEARADLDGIWDYIADRASIDTAEEFIYLEILRNIFFSCFEPSSSCFRAARVSKQYVMSTPRC